MYKAMSNIEKSAFRRGEYVGYGGGQVWRVWKEPKGFWYALSNVGFVQHAKTLRELSQILIDLNWDVAK